MDILLTIIVPAYNVEKTIDTCLMSLVNQSNKCFKVIIVNDGSSDGTEDICRNYCDKYQDVFEYYYQENKGLGGARNTGMEHATTAYLTFLDSDDWLNTKYVEEFYKLINSGKEPDIIFTLPWVYNSVTKWVTPWYDKELFERVFEVKDGKSCALTNSKMRPELYDLEVSACRKIFRRQFLLQKDFRFPEGVKWEDIPGHFYLIHEADVCMAMPQASFFYRTEQSSRTTITSSKGKERLDIIPIFRMLNEIQEKCEFDKNEKNYCLRVMTRFAKWFLEETSEQYTEKLLHGLHEVFLYYTDQEISNYLNTIREVAEKEKIRGFITCLRSNEYIKLKDYNNREKIFKSFATYGTANKKRMMQTGKQMIREKGIGYTAKRAIIKFIIK